MQALADHAKESSNLASAGAFLGSLLLLLPLLFLFLFAFLRVLELFLLLLLPFALVLLSVLVTATERLSSANYINTVLCAA